MWRCQDCQALYSSIEELNVVQKAYERGVADDMDVGECPKCGALCYPED